MTTVRSSRPGRRHHVGSQVAAATLAAAVLLGGASGALAAAPLPQAPGSVALTGIILGVGADESQRIVTWYSSDDTAQVVQVAPTSQVSGSTFPASAVSFAATGGANTSTGSSGYNRHATVTGLKENVQYSYRVGAEGDWSPVYSFRTQSFEGDYDFLFFGDPQIGSSGNVASDTAGWKATLDVALAADPDAELLVSGGDQVETAGTETQWDGFLSPDQLRGYPWAATIGNHDVGSKAYDQHMYTPNTDRSAALYQNGNPSSNTSGGDYWYIYKDVMFIHLNSNSYTPSGASGGDAAHIAYITDVLADHGDEAKYTVLVYHHAIYSTASHAKDGDNKVRRQDFPTAFSNLGVDLVLQGHDHVYSRSYVIRDGEKADPAEQPGQDEVFVGPGGVVYVTANSASGSKYYGLTSPDSSGTSGGGNGADPLKPNNYWYNSATTQENRRSYVKVGVRADKLVVENIRSEAAPGGGVGTRTDSVTIRPYHGDGQDIQVLIPQGDPGEFGWAIDGNNTLVDLGTATEVDMAYFQAAGAINPIAVTDTRRSSAPWSVSSSVSDFADGSKTFSASYLGWLPKLVRDGAGATPGAFVDSGYDYGNGLAQARTLGSAVQGHPRGTGVLGADLVLKVPSTSLASGNYRANLTITALAG